MATQTATPQQSSPPPQTGAITLRQNKENIIKIINRPIFKEQLLTSLMSRLEPDFVIRAAISQLNANAELQECTPVSVASSLLLLAQAGLAPEPWKGHGWLIPRNTKCKEGSREWWEKHCTALIGYRGYVYLAYQTRVVSLANAQPVYEGDVFELDLGSGLAPHHEPWIRRTADRPERGEFLGAYALVKLKDSGEFIVMWMTKEDIDKIRTRSSASAKGPWVTDYIEMARKTAMRRLAKWIPDGQLQGIAALDEASDLGKVEAVLDGNTGQIITVVRDTDEEPAPIQPPKQAQQNGAQAATEGPKSDSATAQSPGQPATAAAPPAQNEEVPRERTLDTSVSQEEPDPFHKQDNPHGKHITEQMFKRMMAILHSAQKMQKKDVPSDEQFFEKVRSMGYKDPRYIPHKDRAVYDELCAYADSGTLKVQNASTGNDQEKW